MQNFVVSARKYRPATFEMVVGQNHITTTLKNAIRNNQLAHAFLFCGPRGVGKTTCARILAKTINCENLLESGEACGSCASCKSYENNNSFNVHELDAASNNSVEDIRQLNEQVRVPPQYGSYKVYIIDEVHMLSTNAFNAFLKTLEEPPRYAIFILATTEKHKILPTILSRCQIFDFNRIKINDIAEQLATVATKEGIGFEMEGLRVIAQKADGGMRDALSMFDMISTFSQDRSVTYAQVIANLHILDSDYYFKVTDLILSGEMAGLLLVFDEILQKGFDGHLFSLGLAEHFRNLLVATDIATLSLLEASEEKQQQFLAQSSKASAGFFLNMLNLISEVDLQYRNSKNQRLLVELSLMKMANLHVAIASAGFEKKKSDLKPTELLAFKPMAAASVKESPRLSRVDFKATPNIGKSALPSPDIASVPADVAKPSEKQALESKPIEKQVLSEVGLPAAMEQYLAWFKETQNVPVSAWKLALEQFTEGNSYYITFGNELSQEKFEDEKGLIIRYFSSHYDVVPFFETMVSNVAAEDIRPYTNAEKLKYLSKKHPKLAELSQRLQLEGN